MSTRFPHQTSSAQAPGYAAGNADDWLEASGPAGRADCCPATAVVRVIMPPAEGRRHSTELKLCGHHYRVSARALAAAHATVIELPGSRELALLPN